MRWTLWYVMMFVLSNYAISQCVLTSGASSTTIQNAENSAGSGACSGSGNNSLGGPNSHTVFWSAGSYSIGTVVNAPNGSWNVGPTISPWTRTTNPTAILTGAPIYGSSGFTYGAGSTAGGFGYLWWNGNLSGSTTNDGGGWIYFPPNTSNVTVAYNQANGINGTVSSGNLYDEILWFDGYAGTSTGSPSSNDSNVNILWNHFGIQGSNDCGPIMSIYTYQGGTYDSTGGECGAIGIYGSTTNWTIAYNILVQMEQPIKWYEPGCSATFGSCYAYNTFLINGDSVYNNDFGFFHRIGMEGQQQPYGAGEVVYNNDTHDQIYPAYGSWQFSLAQCCSPNGLQAPLNFTGNVLVGIPNTGGTDDGPGVEFWSGSGDANNNLEQGYAPLQYGCGTGTWSMNYNITAVFGTTSGGINNEGCSPGNTLYLYQQIGNVNQGWPPVALVSAPPTISPVAGSYTSPLTITLADPGSTSGIGPQGNTSVWYTTDGSTPVPGQGTAQVYTSPFSHALPVTINAVGMWGSSNQPTSYTSGAGFVPSAVVSTQYAASGTTPTLTSIALTPTGANVTVGSSLQLTATCSYTSGPALNCTTPDVYGDVAGTWTSSNTTDATISTGGLLTALAAGSITITAKAGSFTSPALAVTIMAAAPTLTSVTITDGGVGTLAVGQTIQAVATAQYNSGAITTNCLATADAYGTTCGTWTSNTPGTATISGTGLITGVAIGSVQFTVKATNGATAITSPSPLPLTITTPTPPSATLASVAVACATSITVGATTACAATCTYNLTAGGTSTTNCTTTDAYGTLANTWASSSTGVATINSTTGVATGVATGTTNITAHAGSFTSPAFSLTVTPSTSGNVLGNNQYDFAGTTYPNYFVATYAISPATVSVVSYLNLYLPPGTYVTGNLFDAVLVPAPTATTEASTATCSATYTALGTTADAGWHQLVPKGSGCGTIPANTAYWVGQITNATGPVGEGMWDCGGTCTGAAPVVPGNGTYHFWFVSATYGTYTNLPATMLNPCGSGTCYQVSAYASLTVPNPTLTGGYLGTSNSVNSLVTGVGTAQMTAFCSYSSGASFLCYPTADQYGNTVTAFTSSAPSVATIGNIGSAHPGLVTAVSAGSVNVYATLTGGKTTSNYAFTVTAGPAGLGFASGGKKKHK